MRYYNNILILILQIEIFIKNPISIIFEYSEIVSITLKINRNKKS